MPIDQHVFEASCHCRAIGFTFRASQPSESWLVRACQCSFCRAHGARTTSDPNGSVTFRISDASQLRRYQFGTRSAGAYVTNLERVRLNFAEWPNAVVVQGVVPDILSTIPASQVAFLHIDMNSAYPERAVLASLFPTMAFRIEHIGSTAVPGLGAKLIIDVLVGAPSLVDIEARIPAMEALGYQYMPEHEAVLPQRRFFAKPVTRRRQFHLHAVVTDRSPVTLVR